MQLLHIRCPDLTIRQVSAGCAFRTALKGLPRCAPPGRTGPTTPASMPRCRLTSASSKFSALTLATSSASRTSRWRRQASAPSFGHAHRLFLAAPAGFDQPEPFELLQRIGDDMGVLDVEHHADVGERLFAAAMRWRHAGSARRSAPGPARPRRPCSARSSAGRRWRARSARTPSPKAPAWRRRRDGPPKRSGPMDDAALAKAMSSMIYRQNVDEMSVF